MPEVRVIDSDGEQVGVITIEEALKLAQDQSLDLVEVSPTARPPVCKVMDFGKYIFERDKAAHQAKKNQKRTQLKEIKFRPTTDVGDYKVKLNKLTKFLEGGDKCKVTVRFRGREMQHQDIGLDLLKRVAADLEELGNVEQHPKTEGRQMMMIIAPKKST